MRLFKNKPNKQQEPTEGSIMDKAAHAVARSIINWQEKTARLLGRKFTALSRRARLGSLLLFCLLYGGTCLWLLEQAMRTNPREAVVPAVQRTGPAYPEKPAREKASLPPGLRHKESQYVPKISYQLNPFTQPVEGRRLRDSLLQARPGWQDSINYLEQRYQKHSSLLK